MDLQAAATRRLLADGTPAPRGAASGSFAELCLLYAAIGAEPKFLQKTALVAEFLRMVHSRATRSVCTRVLKACSSAVRAVPRRRVPIDQDATAEQGA